MAHNLIFFFLFQVVEHPEEEEPQVEDEKGGSKGWNEQHNIFGLARFDCEEKDERMLSLKRGDGLVILKEARGFFFARLLRSG